MDTQKRALLLPLITGFVVMASSPAAYSQGAESNKPTYEFSTPGPSERAQTLAPFRWRRLPAFDRQKIEIVRIDNRTGQVVVDQRLAALIQAAPEYQEWSRESGVGLEVFQWLNIGAVDVGEARVQRVSETTYVAYIPIAFAVRHFTSGPRQGTLNAMGTMEVVWELDQAGRVQNLRIGSFGDSWTAVNLYFGSVDIPSEWLGRQLGLISRIDGLFLNAVARPVLIDYFSQPANLQAATRASDATTDGQSHPDPTRQRPAVQQ